MGTVVEMRLCWKLLQRPAGQALPSMALPEARAIPKPLAVNSIPSYDAVVKTRKDKINPGLLTYYKKPLYITQGSMQWLWDDQGQNTWIRWTKFSSILCQRAENSQDFLPSLFRVLVEQ